MKFIEIVPNSGSLNTPILKSEDYILLPISAMEKKYDAEIVSLQNPPKKGVSSTFKGKKIVYCPGFIKYIKYLSSNKDSIIFANARVPLSFISCFFGKRRVFMSHQSNLPDKWWKRAILKFFVRKFDAIRVVNNFEKNELVGLGINKDKIFVVPHAIDYKFFSEKISEQEKAVTRAKYGISKSEKCVLFLANLRKFKNPETMLRSLKHLADKGEKVKLIFVGNDKLQLENTESFSEMTRRMDMEKVVVETGPLLPEDIVKIMHICSVGVNTSFHEGQCLVVYEMASAGLPLCLSNIGSFTSVFEKTALFHRPDDYKTLAKNIKKYMDDGKLMQKHVSLNKELVKSSCDFEKVKKELTKVLVGDK